VGALCLTAAGGIRVILDTARLGHDWPSGAAQDRRAWAEVIAYRADGSVIYSSGVVPDGTPVTDVAAATPPKPSVTPKVSVGAVRVSSKTTSPDAASVPSH